MPENINEFAKSFIYEFNNKFTLQKALTHRSYAVEKSLKYDNQRLEFLGDAVIEIILTEYLFVRYLKEAEGHLTKMRSVLAQQATLADFARKIDLGNHLLLGKGEMESGGKNRNSTLSDAFEALMGAIYLDGGLEAARSFLVPLIEKDCPEPDELVLDLNPKGMLQEFTQKNMGKAPEYIMENAEGPDHAPIYSVAVSVNGEILAHGTGTKRKSAEGAAAKAALEVLLKKQKQTLKEKPEEKPEEKKNIRQDKVTPKTPANDQKAIKAIADKPAETKSIQEKTNNKTPELENNDTTKKDEK